MVIVVVLVLVFLSRSTAGAGVAGGGMAAQLAASSAHVGDSKWVGSPPKSGPVVGAGGMPSPHPAVGVAPTSSTAKNVEAAVGGIIGAGACAASGAGVAVTALCGKAGSILGPYAAAAGVWAGREIYAGASAVANSSVGTAVVTVAEAPIRAVGTVAKATGSGLASAGRAILSIF